MRTSLCDQLDIEFPIFAFTHCRDVVAAVSNAGGLGVLGAVGAGVGRGGLPARGRPTRGRPDLPGHASGPADRGCYLTVMSRHPSAVDAPVGLSSTHTHTVRVPLPPVHWTIHNPAGCA